MPQTEEQIIQNRTVVKSRVFHHINTEESGPITVFFGGIHGNEKAGVYGLNSFFKEVEASDFKGEIFAVHGNIKALESNKRFLTSDLNRMWTSAQIDDLERKTDLNEEQQEQEEILHLITQILNRSTDQPIYFIDLHTTSSKSLPFITINDALINRKFSRCFPVPVVLGIEEYLEGPLLSYLNKKGYVSLGFEAGQHTDPEAIKNCEAFISLVLHHTGNFKNLDQDKIERCENHLKMASEYINSIYEVIHKHHIKSEENFKMVDGFKSFQKIRKGTLIAYSNGEKVLAEQTAMLFMPLYQKSGNDGFFIIKNIPKFFLKLSEILRILKADTLLTWLPGITWYDKRNGVLKANLKIAKFLTVSIFHLFGYRNKEIGKTELLLYNRERVSKTSLYHSTSWCN